MFLSGKRSKSGRKDGGGMEGWEKREDGRDLKEGWGDKRERLEEGKGGE